MDTLFLEFFQNTGFYLCDYRNIIMIIVGVIFIYLGIAKDYEPLLLVPIGFGMLLGNIPIFKGLGLGIYENNSVLHYLYFGVTQGIYPPLIFLGIGAMTDFSTLLARPVLMLLGAAAQAGIFITFLGALALGFFPKEAAAIGIIGGADGPTAIFLTAKLAPHLIGPIAVAAYSYMALVPVIQPPIMKLLTSRRERLIRMEEPRQVSKREKMIFPVIAFLLCCFQGDVFLTPSSVKIFVLGALSFGIATASGLLFAKFMNLFLKKKINPLLGAAGVSAVPDSARVVHVVGQREDPSNFLLMHAMAPNVSGVIGSAIAAGVLWSLMV